MFTEVRPYTLLIKRTTACKKPTKRSIIEFRVQGTIRVATRGLLLSGLPANV